MVSSRVFFFLFGHAVAPILHYASEIRDFEEWSKLEALLLKACKYALDVRSGTTTDAVYAELGEKVSSTKVKPFVHNHTLGIILSSSSKKLKYVEAREKIRYSFRKECKSKLFSHLRN